MPFLTGKKFRLSFPDSGEVAVGKISVGYYDVNGKTYRIIYNDPKNSITSSLV